MTDESAPFSGNTHNAALVFADGTVFYGRGVGVYGEVDGEICFNTSLTGYQEILTDPSYAGQIITFTFPHIGNVGTNDEDVEAREPAARGLVLREDITNPSNFRNQQHLNDWLKDHGFVGISGVDTRAITRKIRLQGAQPVVIGYGDTIDVEALKARAATLETLKGKELAKDVTTADSYVWNQGVWEIGKGYSTVENPLYKVVAVDFGAKFNILRNLASVGCEVVVVPADSSAETILSHNPDGIFLSNGPGDPEATGEYALPLIKELMKSRLPIFGICLGHQLLSIALGCKTEKMFQGHRGANHPVQDLRDKRVMITSQNHGFVVSKDNLPANIEITHVSLFDGTIQGIAAKDAPIFSVQGHPEASPGPHDSAVMFAEFVGMLGEQGKSKLAV